jgi:hypothetical protein
MFFLFNDRVLTIAGGPEVVTRAGLPAHAVTKFTLPEVILATQTAIMSDPALALNKPVEAAALAWLLSSRTQANAALFLGPQRCRKPQDVGFRLASVSLTTLGTLKSLQDQGKLTPAMVNASVWQAAAA